MVSWRGQRGRATGRSDANAISGRALLPAPFTIPGFAGLWLSASLASFARIVSQIALSWITLQTTGSPFIVGVVAAARMTPQLVIGIPSGALADWLDRRLLIAASNGLNVALLLATAALAAGDLLTTPLLIGLSVLYGVLDTVRMSATQSHAYALVRTARANSGMALTSLGTQLFSTLGGLAGGYALDRFGSPITFGLIALAALAATAAPYFQAGQAEAAARVQPSSGPGSDIPARRQGVDFGRAMTLVVRNPMLTVLAIAIILAEIFGFATQTLLPTFARDVFDVGASGLGIMMAVRSAGGTLGLLALSRLGAEGRSGLVFVVAAGGFGLALLLFGMSPAYALALVMLGLSGVCASVMDTLGQTLIQRNADERERGAAMGLWVFSVGFGPIGHLALGAAASTFGAPATQTVSGLMLVLVAGLMSANRALRRAR
jgi:MFS family permease